MKRFLVLLAISSAFLNGCSSLEVPGSAKYFSNQPGGLPMFKVASGVGAPTLAVKQPTGKWSKPHPMKGLGPNDPPLSTTPGLIQILKAAYQVDEYVFMEFKADAKVRGQPVPSPYFLLPGGFAYQVPGS